MNLFAHPENFKHLTPLRKMVDLVYFHQSGKIFSSKALMGTCIFCWKMQARPPSKCCLYICISKLTTVWSKIKLIKIDDSFKKRLYRGQSYVEIF